MPWSEHSNPNEERYVSEQQKDEVLGALWDKGSYFTGQLEIEGQKIAVVVFKNKHKTQDKHPDYRILKSKPKGERPTVSASDVPF